MCSFLYAPHVKKKIVENIFLKIFYDKKYLMPKQNQPKQKNFNVKKKIFKSISSRDSK
jgi:hypothetical protein